MTRAGLSEDEREALRDAVMKYVLGSTGAPERFDRTIGLAVEAIVAARTADLAAQVARVEALADDYRRIAVNPMTQRSTAPILREVADNLDAALSPAQPDTERGGRQ